MYDNNLFSAHTSANMHLIADIAKAINGEYSAIFCYAQLAKSAPNEEARNQILEIRDDEINHYKSFSQIYASLTGRQPTPQIIEQCEAHYEAGLRAAFKDEQMTTDFYLDIADRTNQPYIRETFRRASADEQNHAVWFLYYLTAN
ncbi:ferritin-like domain-containing protein [Paenibacillus xerothermodurans]|uniref:Ferritin-like domain-containing protein n=1 Tax=Paenibacillus xerothermodurans TaxID=1977292 RepID=A0A2W1ND51_PAEXE|nr:ferritin-like domain-containing protein [Paenibacillus xerothermodurans]PZE21874.1 ferritin-like domain-containing protein [Paenibacillus xerothermodurans]